MNGRGRGRGRGRGFGRGTGGPPEIKDDDGHYIAHNVTGPPLLYPDNPELADRVDPSQEEEELKAWWRSLTSSWQNSPFFLQSTEAKKAGRKRSLEDFQESGKQAGGVDTSRLAQALTLHPKYFPEELYSAKERRVSVKATDAASQQAFWASQTAGDAAGRFDALANLEAQQGGKDSAAAKGAGEPKFKIEGENEDEPEAAEVDEPDEEDFEDDDYLQGAQYDDDEGYEDDALEDDEGGAYY